MNSRLTSIIKDRPVGIVLHGHSVNELKERKFDFCTKGICWATLNRYWALKDKISPARFELLMVLSDEIYRDFAKKVNAFPGLLITHKNIHDSYQYQCDSGNTLFCFLQLLIKEKVKKVFLFGADGFSDQKDPYVDEYYADVSSKICEHQRDTAHFNAKFPSATGDTEILNVSPQSHYTPFEKITYDQCLSQL
jgi:hypothetical protein